MPSLAELIRRAKLMDEAYDEACRLIYGAGAYPDSRYRAVHPHPRAQALVEAKAAADRAVARAWEGVRTSPGRLYRWRQLIPSTPRSSRAVVAGWLQLAADQRHAAYRATARGCVYHARDNRAHLPPLP